MWEVNRMLANCSCSWQMSHSNSRNRSSSIVWVTWCSVVWRGSHSYTSNIFTSWYVICVMWKINLLSLPNGMNIKWVLGLVASGNVLIQTQFTWEDKCILSRHKPLLCKCYRPWHLSRFTGRGHWRNGLQWRNMFRLFTTEFVSADILAAAFVQISFTDMHLCKTTHTGQLCDMQVCKKLVPTAWMQWMV